jgi:flagellar biosynthesis protein FliR
MIEPVDTLVLALRGAAAVLVITTLAGGVPRLVQLGLAAIVGLWSAMIVGVPGSIDNVLVVAARELVVGATIGLVAVVPILAAATAGRFVDIAGNTHRTYRGLFGVLAAAVFVGIDGHVNVIAAIVESHRDVPAIAATQPRVLDAIGMLIASAVRLAVPWIVTAAVVEIAVGVGVRVAGRTGGSVPTAAAVPAALAMMTAALVGTFAIAFAAIVRGAL